MILDITADCILYVPSGNLVCLTLVNPDKSTQDALFAARPWQSFDTLLLEDKKADGSPSSASVQHVWFVDAHVTDSVANVILVRFVPRPNIHPIAQEIERG